MPALLRIRQAALEVLRIPSCLFTPYLQRVCAQVLERAFDMALLGEARVSQLGLAGRGSRVVCWRRADWPVATATAS